VIRSSEQSLESSASPGSRPEEAILVDNDTPIKSEPSSNPVDYPSLKPFLNTASYRTTLNHKSASSSKIHALQQRPHAGSNTVSSRSKKRSFNKEKKKEKENINNKWIFLEILAYYVIGSKQVSSRPTK
ncbi:hypothetical protein MPH_06509, partial [Macrophomina phaseolina MS6]